MEELDKQEKRVCTERQELLNELNMLSSRVAELESSQSPCGVRMNCGLGSKQPGQPETEYRFEDFFNIDAIQEIQDAFAEAANVASIITDVDGRPITKPSRFCTLCNDVIRKTKKGLRNCMRSDASFGTDNPLQPIIRPCLSSGLWDGGTSIYVGDRHIANWIIGQVRVSSQLDRKPLDYAREIGADEQEYMEAYSRVPYMDRDQFLNVCKALCLIANQISTLAQQNHLQAQAIRRRQQAELALKESEERFRQLSEATFEAIFIHRDGVILEVNKAGRTLFGYSQKELLGLRIETLAVPEYRLIMREYIRNSAPTRFEAQLACRDGRILICEVQERNMVFQGDEVRVCAVRDITERVESERETKEKEQQLIQADKMVSLGILVSGMAHEINNPNSFITLNLPLLSDVWKDVSPILEAYYHDNGDFLAGGLEYSELRSFLPSLLGRMQEGASRIKGIVNSLKDYSRLQPGELMWEADMNDIVRNSLSLLDNLITTRTARFELDLSPSLPPVWGNPQRLSQVLINLIVNSCEALTSKNQGICVASRHLRGQDAVEVTVTDEGPGIPEELLSKITDPFFTTKRDCGGTGLGLSVSSAIVREHHGKLTFSSDPATGTVAKVIVPIAEKRESNA